MEIKYNQFKGRQHHRRKIAAYMASLLIILGIAGALLITYMRLVSGFYVFFAVIGWLILMVYFTNKPWAVERYETDVFVTLYEALDSLQLYDENDESSEFYLEKARKKVKDAILIIESWLDKMEHVKSQILESEYVEPLESFLENLKTRILPRIAQRENNEQNITVLKGLAKLFSGVYRPLSLTDIISKNKDLERYKPLEVEKAPSRLRVFFTRETSKLLLSTVLSFIIIATAVFIRSLFFTTNLGDLFGFPTFIEILALGITMGFGIYQFWKRKSLRSR